MRVMRSQVQQFFRLLFSQDWHSRKNSPIAYGMVLGSFMFAYLPFFEGQQLAAEPQTQALHSLNPQFVDISARTINEITIAATHNSYNYAPKFQAPNVNESITEQLNNGIRAIELDLNYLGKEIKVFHGINGLLGSQPASEVLMEVLNFIKQHPKEVVVIKIHSKIPGADLANFLKQVGLAPYLYVYEGGPVPTFEDLVKVNHRLMIINAPLEVSSKLRQCTTRWNLKAPESLWPPREYAAPCAGDFLSVVAYAVDATLGLGSPNNATQINDPQYLLKLAETAWKLNGKKVWRLEVDFPELGNVYAVADQLNRWNILKGKLRHQNQVLPKISWNCQYSMDDSDVETTTYGNFAFPMKPNETVKITPSHPDYVFSPASLSVTNREGQDIVQNFQATRR